MSEYPEDIIQAAKKAERAVMRAPFPDGGWQEIARFLMIERNRNQWQDIAQYKGHGVVLVVTENRFQVSAFLDVANQWHMTSDGRGAVKMRMKPTHFMALPAPPIPHNPTEG